MFLAADIGDSAQRGANEIGAWVPNLIAAVLILIVGYIIARVLGRLVTRVLERVGFDRTLHSGQAGSFVKKLTASPAKLVGTITFWAIMLGTFSLAVTQLGIPALEDFVATVYAYLPNVFAAFLIFLVASIVAAGIATLVTRVMGDTSLGKIVATVAPILVLTIASFMILEQLKIAHDIVVTTYTLLLGAIALASALAFGLGGRDVAGQMLQVAYEKGQANKEQFKRDLDTGASRAKEEVRDKKDELQVRDSTDGRTEPFAPIAEPSSGTR
jgi:hypothetical protein